MLAKVLGLAQVLILFSWKYTETMGVLILLVAKAGSNEDRENGREDNNSI